ncbi:hypothetical protein Ciccas_008929 [Cichlidogyrus casuarinus]|uniref:Envelope protein n=1 Tax=Cichlidogyrus casuarinus TaxID=1844966 RepID=A0ABD2PZF8_9PLAT
MEPVNVKKANLSLPIFAINHKALEALPYNLTVDELLENQVVNKVIDYKLQKLSLGSIFRIKCTSKNLDVDKCVYEIKASLKNVTASPTFTLERKKLEIVAKIEPTMEKCWEVTSKYQEKQCPPGTFLSEAHGGRIFSNTVNDNGRTTRLTEKMSDFVAELEYKFRNSQDKQVTMRDIQVYLKPQQELLDLQSIADDILRINLTYNYIPEQKNDYILLRTSDMLTMINSGFFLSIFLVMLTLVVLMKFSTSRALVGSRKNMIATMTKAVYKRVKKKIEQRRERKKRRIVVRDKLVATVANSRLLLKNKRLMRIIKKWDTKDQDKVAEVDRIFERHENLLNCTHEYSNRLFSDVWLIAIASKNRNDDVARILLNKSSISRQIRTYFLKPLSNSLRKRNNNQ